MKKPKDEKGILEEDIKRLMTPKAIEDLKELSPTLQTFLIRFVDYRDLLILDDLKKYIKQAYIRDNKRTVNIVTDTVCKKVSEVIAPMYNKLADLETGQVNIVKLLEKMNERLKVLEDQVFITDEKRLQYLERYASWKNTAIRAIAYIIIATSLALILVFQFHYKMK